jgi:threonine/homoserine/homoserine lactone efflux protein
VIGELIWFTLAAAGMAMLAQTAHWLFTIIKYAGAAYLLCLAYRLWTAPVDVVGDDKALPQQRGPRLFLASLTLTLGNPKVMIFFLALLPTFMDLTKIGLSIFLEVAAAICIILTSVLTAYSIAAMRARRLFKSSRAVRWLNRGTGTVMAGAARSRRDAITTLVRGTYMKFAKWLFAIAGIYGLLVVAPLYWREAQIAHDYPPAITHPEYFYGFIGVTVAWQLLFILLSRDPIRHRVMMLPAIVEKVAYGLALVALFFSHRVPTLLLGFSIVDLGFAALFAVAFWVTRNAADRGAAALKAR